MSRASGQASVEWIGLMLLLALGMAALVGFAPRVEAEALGSELVRSITCAARGGCEAAHGARPRGTPRGLVSVPPLVPVAPRERRAPAARPRSFTPPLSHWRRAGRSAGVLWRRSWVLCLGYERVRYGFLNPEVRFPHVPIPLSEDLRMANDCLSPVDLVRDWDLIRGPR